MNEQDVRALVREAIERHLGRPGEKRGRVLKGSDPLDARGGQTPDPTRPLFSDHSSHILLKILPGSRADDGMCVIEPVVRCSHCGFCQSYGH